MCSLSVHFQRATENRRKPPDRFLLLPRRRRVFLLLPLFQKKTSLRTSLESIGARRGVTRRGQLGGECQKVDAVSETEERIR